MPIPMPLPPAPYVAPDLRPIVAQGRATLTFFVDPATGVVRSRQFTHGVWMTPDDAPLEVNFRRLPDGTRVSTQVFHQFGDRGTGLPSQVADRQEQAVDAYAGPAGSLLGRMRDFTRWTIADLDTGETVAAWNTTQCGPTFEDSMARLDTPGAPEDPTFPQRWDGCGPATYVLGRVVGLDRGWAMRLAGGAPRLGRITPGVYRLRVRLNARQHLAETDYANDLANLKLTVQVKDASTASPPCVDCPRPIGPMPLGATRYVGGKLPTGTALHHHADGAVEAHATSGARPLREPSWIARSLSVLEQRTAARTAGAITRAATRSDAPTPTPAGVDLPDLRSAPSFDIGTHVQSLRAASGTGFAAHDYLDFGALTWNAGPGRLEVEAFRTGGTTLAAFQNFFTDGVRSSRQPRGTIMWHAAPGHNHFHFGSFAQYRPERLDGTNVRSSGKNSWCIVDTNLVDTTLPGTSALSQGAFVGLLNGCGTDPDSLWARLSMTPGAGDLYHQGIAGQAFDISSLPNGSYRIVITANPDAIIGERSYANNVSKRLVRLGGAPGRRTVSVPPTPTVNDLAFGGFAPTPGEGLG